MLLIRNFRSYSISLRVDTPLDQCFWDCDMVVHLQTLISFTSDAFVGTDGSTQLAALISKDSRCSPVLSMHPWIEANHQNSSMVLCRQVLVMNP